jgi:hypothetical protein
MVAFIQIQVTWTVILFYAWFIVTVYIGSKLYADGENLPPIVCMTLFWPLIAVGVLCTILWDACDRLFVKRQ